jgi:hypothetical protein
MWKFRKFLTLKKCDPISDKRFCKFFELYREYANDENMWPCVNEFFLIANKLFTEKQENI